MKKIICLILCAAFVFGLCACSSGLSGTSSTVLSKDDSTKDTGDSKVSADTDLEDLKCDDITNVSNKMNVNEFDSEFLKYIAEKKDGNYMVSPLSFRYALGLLLAGAEGNTKTELLEALGVKSVDEWASYCTNFNGFIKWFYDQLNSESYNMPFMPADGDGESKIDSTPKRAIRVANSIWKRENIEEDFTPDYKTHISKNYAAEYNVFTPDNAVKKINAWVNEKTEKLIPRLLPDSYNTENLAVVLMNALYFKNNWQNPFEKFATKEDDFNAKNGQKVKKQFMEQTEYFYYYSDKDTETVILPMYSGVNMAFVLGDTANIGEKVSKAESARVHVKIPKIDTETTFDNKEFMDFLSSRGVSDAFNPKKADFSNMIDHEIWVDDIIQKTKIKTDEEGVEAAAVTAIMTNDTAMMPTEDEPIEFVADRPFSFYIYTTCDDITSMLFAGMITE